MTIIPVRDIASIGVIKDVPPPEAPAQAWTRANNVRFGNRTIRRAPGFRTFLTGLLTTSPYSFYGVPLKSTADYILYTDLNGKVYRRTVSGSHVNVSAPGHVDTASSAAVSYTLVGENCVISRPDEQPWYLAPGAANFAALTGWDSTWKARSVRTFKEFLVALNLTKGANSFPTMVKTSSPSSGGAIPTSWDHTTLSTLATENVLTQLDTEIVDGWPLADDFMIYTSTQCVRMSFTGDDNVFAYRPTGVDGGVINLNCVHEVDGRHYVFGFNDIYVHDGISSTSLVDERVREFVFKHLDRAKADRCFVFHDERLKTLYFCFVSTDPEAFWPNTPHCNRCAALDYSNGTWAFDDFPNVSGAWYANPAAIETWATIAGTWAAASGSWGSFSESTLRIPMIACNPPASGEGRIYAHDSMGDDSYVSELTLDTAYTPPVTLQKVTVDLDELGATLRDYKMIKGLLPQIDSNAVFQIRFGYQMRVKDAITWSDYQNFNPVTDEVVDTMTGGKLVSFEIKTVDTSNDFKFTAYDIDISVLSHK